jgi:hypothetical protein
MAASTASAIRINARVQASHPANRGEPLQRLAPYFLIPLPFNILSCGPDVEALSPPDLRHEIAEAHRTALARYEGVHENYAQNLSQEVLYLSTMVPIIEARADSAMKGKIIIPNHRRSRRRRFN